MSHTGCSVQTVYVAHQTAGCCSLVNTAVCKTLCCVAAQCGFSRPGCACASHTRPPCCCIAEAEGLKLSSQDSHWPQTGWHTAAPCDEVSMSFTLQGPLRGRGGAAQAPQPQGTLSAVRRQSQPSCSAAPGQLL